MNQNNCPEPEALTIKDFCKKLSISQSEVYRLRKNGTLIPGRHFIKIGKNVRYFWSMEVLQDIHKVANDANAKDAPSPQALSRQKTPSRQRGRPEPRVNWDIE